jgi:hypothetical protein
MTAETLVATRAASTFPVSAHGFGSNLKVAYGTYSVAANVEAGDIFSMCKVPKGSTVVMGWVYGADLDTGTEAMDIDVGWAATADEATDVDGFGNFGVWSGDAVTDVKPEVSVWYPFGGVLRTAGPKTFTAEATIQLYANVAANAFTAGVLTVVVLYAVA